MFSATRDLVSSPGSSKRLPARRFAPYLSRAIALAVAALALGLTSTAALAADLTVHLGPPSGGSLISCNILDGCAGTASGSLTDVDQPGSYLLQFTLEGPLGAISDPVCFTPPTPADPTLNQATLTFTSPDGLGNPVPTGQVVLTTGILCLSNSVADPSSPADFSLDFTIQSGTND